MTLPDVSVVSEGLLFSMGFNQSKQMARKIVETLRLFSQQLSIQNHYDFGLRAAKSVLNSVQKLMQSANSLFEADAQETTSPDGGDGERSPEDDDRSSHY